MATRRVFLKQMSICEAFDGPKEGKSSEDDSQLIAVTRFPFTIGRKKTNLLCLRDDAAVSGNQCTIVMDDEGIKVVDNASTNGTWVRGHLISEKTLVSNRDLIVVGRTVLQVIFSERELEENRMKN